ncbi:MAG: ABC transporter permease [Gemmatimonadota bacterium]
MNTLFQDLRYGARTLARSPGFTVVAILTLALGIGANATMFSVVDAVLLRPPPHVSVPERLVHLYTSDFSGPQFGTSSFPDYRDLREGTDSFQGIAAAGPRLMQLTVDGVSERLLGGIVTGNYFGLLGVRTELGRTLLPSDDASGADPAVAVISHALWQRHYGGGEEVIGRTVRIQGSPFTIVGVAPDGFTGIDRPDRTDVWVPMSAVALVIPGTDRLEQRGTRWLRLVGRLQAGATPMQAQAALDSWARRLHEQYPETWTDVRDAGRHLTLRPESEARLPPSMQSDVLGFMGLLGGVVGLVLLIACANMASLLLARATQRQREMAVRRSLGASRGRLIRQLLTESTLLALLGGGGAMLLTVWLTQLLANLQLPLPFPTALDFGVDRRVIGFTVALSVLTGLLFGISPAMRASSADIVSALKQQGRPRFGLRRIDLRSTLVVAQVAVSIVLVIGAGLFARSLRNASTVDPGFDTGGVLLVGFAPDLQGYSNDQSRQFYQALLDRLATIPAVQTASLAEIVPLTARQQRAGVGIEGYEAAPGEDMEFDFNVVTPGYFRTMRIPLVRGRSFTDLDRADASRVVVVNEAFAERFWPGGDPIGQRISYSGSPAEVVGVIPTTRLRALDESPRPAYYAPLEQAFTPGLTLHVRTSGDAAELTPVVRQEVLALEPGMPMYEPTTLSRATGGALFPQRVAAATVGGFGLLALALATVGLYGLIAYTVAGRGREVGIRMALGARRSDVLGLVLRQGIGLAVAGLALGIPAAAALTHLASGFLFEVSPLDPSVFAVAAAALVSVAALASYLPARRASGTDPMTALRSE